MNVIITATKRFDGTIDIELFDYLERIISSNSHPGKIRKSQELLDLEYAFRIHPNFLKYKKLYESKQFAYEASQLLLKLRLMLQQVSTGFNLEKIELLSYIEKSKIINGAWTPTGNIEKIF